MLPLNTGLSGLTVSQRLLELTGQNIANAGTPGYHRQEAILAPRSNGGAIGAGAEVQQIRRVVNTVIETALNQNAGTAGDLTRQLEGLRQVESLLAPGAGSLHELVERFFNQAQQLTTSPQDLTQRRQLLATAGLLTARINEGGAAFQRMRDSILTEGRELVGRVNELTARIARLNEAIQGARVRGGLSNELEDERDLLISQLAELIDVRAADGEFGQKDVWAAGMPVVLGDVPTELQWGADASGRVTVSPRPFDQPLSLSGGKLRGVLTLLNESLPALRGEFDVFARALVAGVDAVHARGLGLSGPFTFLGGERAVRDVSVPLATAGLAFPPRAGSVFVSMTDLATGSRTLHEVTIDPATQSLQDVAAALSTLPGLTAIADPQTGTLKLLAAPGRAFDFTGRLPTAVDLSGFGGSAALGIGGSYTGAVNDAYRFTVVGSGNVGASSPLSLEVRDGAGTLLQTLNIGLGYEPGTDLPAVNGVRVRLGPGTVTAGDTFTVPVAADPDTAGALAALGLNTFFVGDGAGSLAVRPDLVQRPERLALARSADPGDADNLVRLAGLRDRPLLGNGRQTLADYLVGLTGRTAADVQSLELQSEAAEGAGRRLEEERQAISGVDPNEEMVRLIEYQRSFQASARYLSVINEALDDLLGII